jgi:putative acetyltransferase
MNYSIVPAAEEHFVALRRVLEIVAHEKRFLAFTEVPSVEESFAFYREIVANGVCQFVAIDSNQVVGWCDVLPTHGQARAHVGTLGIGLLPSVRHSGLGARLLATTVAKAQAKGITRIELTVRVDNLNAKALYEKHGFQVEGVQQRYFLIDGQYYDAIAMTLLS